MNNFPDSHNEKKVMVFTDGASRGNPGDSGIGVLILDSKGKRKELKNYLGKKTNNQAEYSALILALENLTELTEEEIIIHTDSQLMASQMNEKWKVKDDGLRILYSKAKQLSKQHKKLKIIYIPRELNKEADRLANDAINEYFND
ncbi:MAG: ribonuclease HI family protein [Thermodesulfobacteriota bacterium]